MTTNGQPEQDGYTDDTEIVAVDGSRTTVAGLVALASWSNPEAGQTTGADTMRLHLLSEHGDQAALGYTDDQAEQQHTRAHDAGTLTRHASDRRTWSETKILVLLIDLDRGDGEPDVELDTLTKRWNAHYGRVAHDRGLPYMQPAPEIPDPDPAVYDADDVDETMASNLTVLAMVRKRLAAHLGWAPEFAVRALDVVDETAREILDEHRWDLDDEAEDDEAEEVQG